MSRNIKLAFAEPAVITFEWTDEEPDGESVFATLVQAKTRALTAAIPNRDDWARCVRNLRSMSHDDIQGAPE